MSHQGRETDHAIGKSPASTGWGTSTALCSKVTTRVGPGSGPCLSCSPQICILEMDHPPKTTLLQYKCRQCDDQHTGRNVEQKKKNRCRTNLGLRTSDFGCTGGFCETCGGWGVFRGVEICTCGANPFGRARESCSIPDSILEVESP